MDNKTINKIVLLRITLGEINYGKYGEKLENNKQRTKKNNITSRMFTKLLQL